MGKTYKDSLNRGDKPLARNKRKSALSSKKPIKANKAHYDNEQY